ncbi:hypothetical protein ORV05_12645 [Amycolatopsis cynarae]|uniref:Uncharacterized protein n=1 Tax=Amycolatopsis cynarae TaxID=2995223 RepID=A0ABY7B9G0_9PSEU|nr:hypothetical protein [Amycolatopsis sp. HUAS 11-8]WAL68579.1 hypothetical protein ORV05_12645 [Amycolatopsis sp. HUAS 11-8]
MAGTHRITITLTPGSRGELQRVVNGIRDQFGREQLIHVTAVQATGEAADGAQARVLAEIAAERARQDARWGEQNHPDGTGAPADETAAATARRTCEDNFRDGKGTWRDIFLEEVHEAIAEADPVRLRAELVQTAAVAVNWIEAIDRRNGPGEKD